MIKIYFSDIAILFYLVVSVYNIIKLIGIGESWSFGMAIAVVITCLIAIKVLVSRLKESWKLEKILKTEIGQNAIAAIAKNPGYNQQQAEKTIRAMCVNTTAENAQVMLRAITHIRSSEAEGYEPEF